jgi:predicted nucleic acid-binding protein
MPIESCLVDTNILLRISRKGDPQHELIDAALGTLASAKCPLYYTHQNIAELWNTMTRPATKNGFGLRVDEADREVRVIEAGMHLLPDNEAVYREWRRIIADHAVVGGPGTRRPIGCSYESTQRRAYPDVERRRFHPLYRRSCNPSERSRTKKSIGFSA